MSKNLSLRESLQLLGDLPAHQQITALQLLSRTTAIEFPEEAVQAVADKLTPKGPLTLEDIKTFERKFAKHLTGKSAEANLEAFDAEVEKIYGRGNVRN